MRITQQQRVFEHVGARDQLRSVRRSRPIDRQRTRHERHAVSRIVTAKNLKRERGLITLFLSTYVTVRQIWVTDPPGWTACSAAASGDPITTGIDEIHTVLFLQLFVGFFSHFFSLAYAYRSHYWRYQLFSYFFICVIWQRSTLSIYTDIVYSLFLFDFFCSFSCVFPLFGADRLSIVSSGRCGDVSCIIQAVERRPFRGATDRWGCKLPFVIFFYLPWWRILPRVSLQSFVCWLSQGLILI